MHSQLTRIRAAALGSAAILTLSACVAGPAPEIATPVPELPDSYLFAGNASEQATLAQLLPENDPAFRRFRQLAMANSPTLGEALARIEQARANAARAGAERLPNIGADASAVGSRTNIGTIPDNAPFDLDLDQITYAANITARWDPDIFGALRAQQRAALLRVEAAEAGVVAIRLGLTSEIAASVVDWRTLEARRVEINKDFQAANQLAKLAKVREDAGLAPGFDRVRAETIAAAARSRLASIAAERYRLAGRISTLTTVPIRDVFNTLAINPQEFQRLPAPKALPSELLVNRPDILQAAANLAATDAQLAATARQRFPRLDLSAAIGLLAFRPSGIFDADSIVGSLAASIAGPLLDFGRIDAEIEGAAAEKKVAFQSYRGAVYAAIADAEAGYGVILSTDSAADAAIAERIQAQRAERIANSRYEAGLADFLTVLDARRSASASAERAATAIGEAQRARILLWQALGGGSFEN